MEDAVVWDVHGEGGGEWIGQAVMILRSDVKMR